MPDRATAAHNKDIQGGTGSTNTADLAVKTPSAHDDKAPDVPDVKSRVTVQNTYRVESKAPFDRDRVGTVMGQIMEEMLTSAQYDPTSSGKLAEQVCTEIMFCVREMNFDRYRYIILVSIYEKMFQGISSKSNALWDNERDDSVTYTFSNNSMTAVGIVYGIYYD